MKTIKNFPQKTNQALLKKLTWKYFWKQKLNEIGITFGILFAFTILPWLMGYIGCYFNPIFVENFVFDDVILKCHTGFWVMYGLGWVTMLSLFIVILAIGLIIAIIIGWIYNNWEKAEKRAREELK